MIFHEVGVIGGSLAGAACVRELERLGIDTVAFERDRFPRAKVCGGFMSPGAVACIEQLGLLDEVTAAGAVRVDTARLRVGAAIVDIPFREHGLGISRAVLDEIVARRPQIRQGSPVRRVYSSEGRFVLSGESFEVSCRVLIDAAGKLSRFTRRKTVDEFGLQYLKPGDRGSRLDFWFFEHGYGGAVSVEGCRSNFCFLLSKEKLEQYLDRSTCLVTGPLAYESLAADYIAIGDARGMVDPFCGEGIRHALDSGMIAAQVVARGVKTRKIYEEIRHDYEYEWRRRWARRRALARAFRTAVDTVRKGWRVNRHVLALMSRLWLRYSE
jgi:flavin-dependent dehydrogenase